MSRWETFRLLADLIAPGGMPAPPPDADWEELIAASSHHLVTPALAWSLRGAGIAAEPAQYLAAVLELNRERNQALAAALADALAVLDSAGLAPLLLKGAASQVQALYPDPAIRVVGDLDLLAPDGRAEDCHALLAANGFTPDGERDYPPSHHHLKPLRHDGTGMFVELHRFASVAEHRDLLPVFWLWRDARRAGRAFVSAPAQSFAVALVHTMLQDRHFRAGTLSLRHMLELALLLARDRDAIDWDVLGRHFTAAGCLPALQLGCELPHLLFGTARVTPPPAGDVLAPFRAKLERPLPAPSRILLRALDAIRARPGWALDYLRPSKLPGRLRRLAGHVRDSRWSP